ncbi:hypothetical protein BJ912DRAFT_927383 [Pholiota molesta]|nr:hypothetical protein BJ912DRAFT_927383 [Pholiota molesta]
MAAALVSRVTASTSRLPTKRLRRRPRRVSGEGRLSRGRTVDGECCAYIAEYCIPPDEVKWRARTARRLAENPDLAKTPLLEGFPQELDSPLVWGYGRARTGQTGSMDFLLSSSFQWPRQVLRAHLVTTFPLPTLGPVGPTPPYTTRPLLSTLSSGGFNDEASSIF